MRHDQLVAQDEELQSEIDELRREVAEERLARARVEVRLEGIERAHTAELGAKDAIISELRAMLDAARRPWWWRWAGR
jgi:hypothetical protein